MQKMKIKNIKSTFLLVYLVCVFNLFYLTPVSVFSDVFLLFFSFLGLISLLKAKYFFGKRTFGIVFSIIALWSISVFSSMLNRNQDFFSAIIAAQNIFKCFSVFYFFDWIVKEKVDLNAVLRKLNKIIYFYVLLIVYMSLSKSTFVFTSPLSGNELLVSAAKMDKSIIFFAVIHYLVKFFIQGGIWSLFLSFTFFLSTQLYDIQRGDIIFIFLLALIIWYTYRQFYGGNLTLLFLPLFSIVFILILGSVDYTLVSQKFGQMMLLFEANDSSKISDPSIFVRLSEWDYAKKGFLEHPVFGNGLIRASQQVKLLDVDYFYPSDVGLMGILYCFGLIGIFIFLYLSFRVFKSRPDKNLVLLSSIFYFCIFLIISSFKDGSVLYFPALLVFLLVILLFKKKHAIISKEES